MDPEACYLGFLRSPSPAQPTRPPSRAPLNLFGDGTRLRIIPPRSRVSDYIALIHELPEQPTRLGEILVEPAVAASPSA